jgi:tetratricopeptide (TPR) repeat protein
MRVWISVALATALAAQQIPPRNEAANWMNKGIDEYRHGQFEQAADAFEKAAELDPTNPNAHLYAGSACVMLYVPGSDFPDNIMYFERAKTEFKRTLDLIPTYPPAMASLGKLIFQQAQGTRDPDDKLRLLDESAGWYQKLEGVDPRNKEAWYTLGAIAWMKCHPALVAARSQLGMKADDPGPLPDVKPPFRFWNWQFATVRQKLKAKFGPLIEEGIASLEGAIRLDPRYDEAMDYMTRLLRDRADLRDSPVEYRQDIAEANQWAQRMTETRKMTPPLVRSRGQRN